MTKQEFIDKYGWEITDAVHHEFISHDAPAMNRRATVTEVILWNELTGTSPDITITPKKRVPSELLRQKGDRELAKHLRDLDQYDPHTAAICEALSRVMLFMERF